MLEIKNLKIDWKKVKCDKNVTGGKVKVIKIEF